MSSSFCWQVQPHKLWILPSKLILYIKTGFVSLPTLYSSPPTSHFQHSLNIHWHNSCRACACCFLACERAHSSLQLYLQRMPSRWQLTAHSFKAVPSSWPALELSAMAQSLWGRGGGEETAWLPPLHLQFQNAHWFGTKGTHGSASSYFNNESHKHLYQKIKSNYYIHKCHCCCSIISDWPVISSSEQLVLRSDGAVDGGVGSLRWGLDEKTEGLD